MALREVVKVYSVFDLFFTDKQRAYESLEASPYNDKIVELYVGMDVIDLKHLNFEDGVYRAWFDRDFIFTNYIEAYYKTQLENYRKASGKVAL